MSSTSPTWETLSLDQTLALRHAASRLAGEFDGTFGAETIERFLHSSYDQFADRASVGKFLPLMAERGVDIAGEFPKPWTDETVRAADVVITMGCGDACPIFPGKRYEDWPVDDPAGQDLDTVRRIRDDLERRVRRLLSELKPAPVARADQRGPATPR